MEMVIVLLLFVVSTCKWSINLFTSPNPVYSHTHTTWQYVIVCHQPDIESSKFILSFSNLSAKFKCPLAHALKYLFHNPETELVSVAVTLWIRILQVLGSNPGRDTGFLWLGLYVAFLSPSEFMPSRSRLFSSKSFPVHHTSFVPKLHAVVIVT
jgi:hypothetical protein